MFLLATLICWSSHRHQKVTIEGWNWEHQYCSLVVFVWGIFYLTFLRQSQFSPALPTVLSGLVLMVKEHLLALFRFLEKYQSNGVPDRVLVEERTCWGLGSSLYVLCVGCGGCGLALQCLGSACVGVTGSCRLGTVTSTLPASRCLPEESSLAGRQAQDRSVSGQCCHGAGASPGHLGQIPASGEETGRVS